MENDSDNKAQYQKTCNDRDGSYDLRRYNLRDKPNGTDNDRKQDSEFDEACPTEVTDLLGRSRLLLDIIGFVRCVCLDEGRCVNVLIHDDCIHIGAFNSSRAITRYSSTQSQVFVKLLVCGEEWLSWLLKLQKLPMVLHQVMFSPPIVGRPLTSMSRTIVPVSSV